MKNFEKPVEKEKIDFIRHSKAGYKSYKEVLNSDNPDQPLDINKQVFPDILEPGIELAKQEAEKLFSEMNPETEALFFVSSNQARALETAKIYKDISKEKGFTVIVPEHHYNPLSKEMNEEEIRVVETLSLKPDSSLWSSIYNPPAYLGSINWEGVEPDLKLKWEEARQIILKDDKGNWGANFSQYSDILKEKELLPNDQRTAQELFEVQFPQILRLARFGAKKAQEGFEGKKVRIIAFGHENYLAKAIEKYFEADGINNCEAMHIEVEDEKIIGKFRNKETSL
ncbi:MAG: hypothetical protein NTY33_00050 [Candidatus Moranbacteria bacterium]|nr:hypothetical protein [Candidatus Moranbacteria bacterium]